MAKVVTFGELMIRLQPYNYERFVLDYGSTLQKCLYSRIP